MPIVKIGCVGDEAVATVTDVLNESGLRVITSFDSQLVRTPASCPHHGTAVCDCQVVILLIYDKDGQPATLLAHGQDGETWISLAVAPEQRPSARLENRIKQALSPSPPEKAVTT